MVNHFVKEIETNKLFFNGRNETQKSGLRFAKVKIMPYVTRPLCLVESQS